MLHIVCVNAGNYCGRGAQYVNTLFDMIRRNLAEGYKGRFVCLTDNPEGIEKDIWIEPLPPGLNGWWNKLALFKPGLFPEGDRVVYFDLDTLITGRLDEICAYDGTFAILEDFYRGTRYGGEERNAYQSSVMAWRAGSMDYIWENWQAAGCPDVLGGDQIWVEQQVQDADCFQEIFPELFISFKVSGKHLPRKASVVVFHGHPRPHEVTEGWVPMVWKVGGLARAELDTICNTQDEIVHSHIRYACSLDFPWLEPLPERLQVKDRHVMVVGGGWSLPGALDEIKVMREQYGYPIWAVNGAHDYLIERGIVPDACFLLDARESNAKFVANARDDVLYYVASQCHPDVFKALSGKRVTMYHNATYGAQGVIEDCTEFGDIHLIGGGTTVGMKAVTVARFLGFRFFHLYGMDSCYQDGEHHAYSQPENDGERILDIQADGKAFKCSPWMVTQANDFIEMAAMLVQQGCTLTVNGPGMLAHLARGMAHAAKNQERATIPHSKAPISYRDGWWWPDDDKEALPYLQAHSDAIKKLAALCSKRRVVVQAGGNAGMYPAILSDLFDHVYTFEPDWRNFAALSVNAARPNVYAMRACVGNMHGGAALRSEKREAGNLGALHIGGPGDIPLLMIDDLQLPMCDLIWLDVEGYEYNALLGAEKTIERCRPIIALELKQLARRYGGVKDAQIADWLRKKGYVTLTNFYRDTVFCHKEVLEAVA